MQISRHWRIKPQRYRLEGIRFENGEVSLQVRPTSTREDVTKASNSRESQPSAQPMLAGK